MTGRRFVTAAAVLSILATLSADPAPGLKLRGEPGAVVFATEGVRLAAGSVVAAGDVVVNGAADDRADAVRGRLVVAPGARVPGGSILKGDRLIVRPGARVDARLVCNTLLENGAAGGSGAGGGCAAGLALPVTRELPAFRRALAVPGRALVRTAPGEATRLAPGIYQGVHARRGSTVRLEPGVYHLGALVVSRGARLVSLGEVEIRLTRRLYLGPDAVVGPADAGARGPVLHVGGEDRDRREGRPRRSAVTTGPRSTLAASVYAPFGTVHLGPRSQARGLFLGRRVLVGRDAVVVPAPAPAGGTPGGPGDSPPGSPGLPDQDEPGGGPGDDPPAGGDPDDPSEPPPDLDDPSEPPADDPPDGGPGDPDDPPDQDRPPAGVAAFDVSEQTFVDEAVTLTLLGDAPGTASLRFAVTGIPLHGTLGPVVPGSEEPVRSATVTYTPDPGFQGPDAFELQACATVDGEEACDGATARLDVREPSCLVDPRFCDDGR